MGGIILTGGQGQELGANEVTKVQHGTTALEGEYIPPSRVRQQGTTPPPGRPPQDWNKVIAILTVIGLLLIGLKAWAHYVDGKNRREREGLVAYSKAISLVLDTGITLDAAITSGASFGKIMEAEKPYKDAKFTYDQAKEGALECRAACKRDPLSGVIGA